MEPKVLNLDEFIAEQPSLSIRYKGVDHEVVNVSGEVYLKFIRLRSGNQKQKGVDPDEVRFKSNIELLMLLLPSMVPLRESLERESITAIARMVEFVVEGLGPEFAPPKTDVEGASRPGE